MGNGQEGSNRTFMELKLCKDWIVETYRESSNRTFMELKSRRSCRSFLQSAVLIVPLWN